jgi:outer membrane lipoprotein-sorting protein
MALPFPCRTRLILLLICHIGSYASAETPLDTDTLLKKMETAYAGVNDYRASMEVRTFKEDGSSETERFFYTFKKPKWIRLDFESPHAGMILVYPDKNGKVAVRPAGLAHFLKFHLAPDSRLLKGSSGQRIDQTDIGLLIKNIAHSLTDQRRGPVEMVEENGHVRVRVKAVNHFHEDVVTLYQFLIDKKLWLPAKVEESTPDGRVERVITFEGLTINSGVPDSFFQLDEAANQSNEQSNEK